MKAWVLHGINDLQLHDVPKPTPKKGEVLVRVKAVGICTSDIARVFGNGAYYYPIILGHEFAGVTEDGRRVGVFPLLPCHKCGSCQQGHYETCLNYSYIGSRRDGAFAEYVAVPEWNLVVLPDYISFEQAALFEPAAVALHAVGKMDMTRAQSVAVVGNGVMGELVTKWLSICGITDVALLGREAIWTKGQYDACFEAVGTADAFKRCVELVKPNSQILLIGNPDSNFLIDQKLFWQILRKQITIHGIWNSRYPAEWQYVHSQVNKLQLDHFISHRFKFEELNNAFDFIYQKRERHKKVVVLL